MPLDGQTAKPFERGRSVQRPKSGLHAAFKHNSQNLDMLSQSNSMPNVRWYDECSEIQRDIICGCVFFSKTNPWSVSSSHPISFFELKLPKRDTMFFPMVHLRSRELRELLLYLGPCYVKLGQARKRTWIFHRPGNTFKALANRPDIIRDDYMVVLPEKATS